MNAVLAKVIERSRRETEDWRYTDVEKLLGRARVSGATATILSAQGMPCLIDDRAQHQRIVFIDGMYRCEKSQLGQLPATIVQGDNQNGYRLVLAAQSCLVTAPLHLVFIASGAVDTELKLTVEAGANASLTIIEHHLAQGGGAPSQMIDMDIRLGEQAKLVHKKILHALTDAAQFARTTVQVAEGAYYRSFSLVKDIRLMRNEIDVTLMGPLAQCNLYGALLLQAHEHADVLTRVHHEVPHGTSRQLFKAVVKDQARGVFQGRIKVAEGAQKTDGQQLCRALLLSDQAEMDAKPELEIYADDVSCSHGCAVGDLDANAMFYLRSRGLNEAEARALLLRAFVDEVIDKVQAEGTRSFVRDLAERWMHEQA